MTASTLIPGPLFFHDQTKTRKSKRVKKMPEELPFDVKTMNVNPRLAAIINSLSKKQKAGHMGEKNEEVLLKDDAAGKEKLAVVPEILTSTMMKDEVEDPKLSQVPPSNEDLQMSPFDEYKYTAPTLLCELGNLLDFFSPYEMSLPQGLVNVLNQSWKELTEGAVYPKKHWRAPVDCGTKAGAQEQGDKPAGSEVAITEKVKKVKNNKNKKCATQAENTKEKNREAAPNKPPGNKVPVTHPQLHVTISFSMSSRMCVEQGWIFQNKDPESEEREWNAMYRWAVERLQLAQLSINKQSCDLKEKGFHKAVILRHYDDSKKEAFSKPKKQACEISTSFVLQNGKPLIPEIKKKDPVLKKLHYSLIDGSSLTYYPSGHLAVCQSHSGLPCGGIYSNIYSNTLPQSMLASFTPFGLGSVSLPDSNIIVLMFNQKGGMTMDREGEVTKEWRWPPTGRLNEPVIVQVNEYMTVRIAGQFAISLIFKFQQESIRLSVSSLQGVVPQPSEELDLLLTKEKFSSKAAKQLAKGNRKKPKEKEAKKPVKKELVLSELVKTLEIPEVDLGPANDFSAITELRKLQRKVKNILDDWMEHYRIAAGIDSPHMRQMSSAPRKTARKRKIQSAVAPSVAQDLQTSRENDPSGPEDHPWLSRFQSAPAGNAQWDISKSSPSPRSSLLNSFFRQDQASVTESGFNNPPRGQSLNKSGIHLVPPMPVASLLHDQSLWCNSHMTCPVVLRRIAMGEESQQCRCSNHQIPFVTDLAFDHLIRNRMSALEQIIVVCVISSVDPEDDPSEGKLEQLYERKNQFRSMPCMQSRLDSFRLLKYDVSTANELPGGNSTLLVQRHNIAPGMFLNCSSARLCDIHHPHRKPEER
uniref:Uncharacterized protein C3orf20 homolog isoform X2 n=1 Tax=Geotrypetes seraphini TaxID=260995 RepID=A0A6P8RTN7_GEOSA|nr:uncharacterized protein C3orf20 homolog isoform X2 [Geotrypetes seraphini]